MLDDIDLAVDAFDLAALSIDDLDFSALAGLIGCGECNIDSTVEIGKLCNSAEDLHVSAFSFCIQCDKFGHNEFDHSLNFK